MVSTTLPPLQTAGAGGDTTSGSGLTVTVTEAVAEHPLASVPVIVYVVVAGGDAITELPVQILRLVQGDHTYVDAPAAVSTVESPTQIEGGAEVRMTGKGFTVTVTESVAVLPTESVTVT
jgi:hypothetical protein